MLDLEPAVQDAECEMGYAWAPGIMGRLFCKECIRVMRADDLFSS